MAIFFISFAFLYTRNFVYLLRKIMYSIDFLNAKKFAVICVWCQSRHLASKFQIDIELIQFFSPNAQALDCRDCLFIMKVILKAILLLSLTYFIFYVVYFDYLKKWFYFAIKNRFCEGNYATFLIESQCFHPENRTQKVLKQYSLTHVSNRTN